MDDVNASPRSMGADWPILWTIVVARRTALDVFCRGSIATECLRARSVVSWTVQLVIFIRMLVICRRGEFWSQTVLAP